MRVFILICTLFAGLQTMASAQSPALTTTVVNDEKEALLADGFQRTLYTFDLDQGQKAPKCVADCAEVWPPYIITAAEAQSLKAPLGSIARTNGKLQLTYEGKPLYQYIFDRIQGDDKGDGIGDVWHYVELK
jgi:predicted lipoprotein with Yx(FWY)xxD motif